MIELASYFIIVEIRYVFRARNHHYYRLLMIIKCKFRIPDSKEFILVMFNCNRKRFILGNKKNSGKFDRFKEL